MNMQEVCVYIVDKGFCVGVGLCLSFTGVARPTSGVHPLCSVAGGVHMDAEEDDV